MMFMLTNSMGLTVLELVSLASKVLERQDSQGKKVGLPERVVSKWTPLLVSPHQDNRTRCRKLADPRTITRSLSKRKHTKFLKPLLL